MSHVGKYLFSVITAALATALASLIINTKTPVGSIVKMVCGVFLAITMISPIIDIPMLDLTGCFSSVSLDAQSIAQSGLGISSSNQKEIINERVTAYVLEKAEALNMDITAHVEFTDAATPTPYKIYLEGAASPYAKDVLVEYITEHLGITEEYQVWN